MTVEGRRGGGTDEPADGSDGEEEGSEWVYSDEVTDNDYTAIDNGWDVDNPEDPGEVCPVLEADDSESAQDLFNEICDQE